MKRFVRHQSLLSAILLIGTLLPGWVFADTTFKKLCIFGDSLSDTGNVFEVEHDVSTRPYDLIPSFPYPIGGPTFSNGRTWIQHFAKSLGRSNDAKPAFRGSGPFCNYSFGSARARQRAGQPFDLPGLVTQYFEDFENADPNTLYIVFVGGNDIRDAVVAYPSDPNVSENILTDAVTAIGQGISELAAGGARKFLIMNAPNVALVPAVSAQGPGAQGLAQYLSSQFNDGLASALGFLPPGLEVMSFDVFSFTNGMAASPPEGVINATDSCITPGVRKDAICAAPDQYVYWDGIHPTRVIHAAFAEAVARALPAMLASSASSQSRLAQLDDNNGGFGL